MSKIKIVEKNGVRQLKFTASREQEFNSWEASVLNNGRQTAFLPLAASGGSSENKLYFTMSGYCTLREFLPLMPLKKKTFAHLVRSILAIVQTTNELNFNQDRILFDISYIMINPSDWDVRCIYIPVSSFQGMGTLQSVLSDIAVHARFEDNLDTSFLHEYMHLVSTDVIFSAFDLEKLLKRLTASKASVNRDEDIKRCPRCGSIIVAGGVCRVCGGGSFGAAAKKPETGTKPSSVWLMRSSNGEMINITKFPFRIGKAADKNDYCVDNRFVSGAHAEILLEGRRCFITDKFSTNGTYLNDKQLVPSAVEQLHDNDCIRLADEIFIFHINTF